MGRTQARKRHTAAEQIFRAGGSAHRDRKLGARQGYGIVPRSAGQTKRTECGSISARWRPPTVVVPCASKQRRQESGVSAIKPEASEATATGAEDVLAVIKVKTRSCCAARSSLG